MSDDVDYAAWNAWVVGEFRANGGAVPGYETMPVLLLTTTGATSGEPRLVPLVYVPDGDRYLVFAVNSGRPYEPAWYRNLLADPHATVEVEDATFAVVARVAEGDEHDDLWAKCLSAQPSYHAYVADRQVPAVVLEPVSG